MASLIAVEPVPAPEARSEPWNEKANSSVEISIQQRLSVSSASDTENVKESPADTVITKTTGAVQSTKLAYEPKFELESRAIDEFRPLRVCWLISCLRIHLANSD